MKLNSAFLIHFVLASAVIGYAISYSNVYLFHISLGLLILGLICSRKNYASKGTLYYPKDPFVYFLYFFAFWYLLSIFWSIDPVRSLQYLVYIIVGVSLVFIINAFVVDRSRYQSVFNTLRLMSLIAICIAVLEALTDFRLPTSPYSQYAFYFGNKSMDFYQFNSSTQDVLKSSPTSFWGNPNTFSVAMTLIAPFFLMHKKSLVSVLGTLTLIFLVMMAGSRGALLGLIFAISLSALIKGWRSRGALILLVTLFTLNINGLKQSEIPVVSNLSRMPELIKIYFLEDRAAERNSIGYRQQLIQNGLQAFWESGGLGVGGGASLTVQERLGGVDGRLLSMHNFWVEILVEAGFAFFLLFTVWYSCLSIKLYRIFRQSRSYFFKYHAGAFFIGSVTFLISAVSASSVIYLLPMWLFFGMSIAVVRLYRIEKLSAVNAKKIEH